MRISAGKVVEPQYLTTLPVGTGSGGGAAGGTWPIGKASVTMEC